MPAFFLADFPVDFPCKEQWKGRRNARICFARLWIRRPCFYISFVNVEAKMEVWDLILGTFG